MNTGLAGRVAIVTGAASGIGRAGAHALADEGCNIVAADRRPPVEGYPAEWLGVTTDVTSPTVGEELVRAARDRYGRVDVLVACAGVYDTEPAMDVDLEAFDRVQAVNVRGSFACARAAMSTMGERGWGRIVLFSSIVAHTGGVAAGPAYVASKAAIIGLTRSLAHTGGPLGVTVNCVNPGIIETQMTSVIDAATKKELAARTPLRRNGRPEDVAAVVVMLASEGAGFVTGAHVDVNGGLAMT